MAIERLFSTIKEDVVNRAADQSQQAADMFRVGQAQQAEEKIDAAKKNAELGRRIDEIVAEVLQKLTEAGIEQPSVEYFQDLVSQVTSRFTQEEPEQSVQTSKADLKEEPSKITATPPSLAVAHRKESKVQISADVKLFPKDHSVSIKGTRVKLGTSEFKVFQRLFEKRGQRVSKEELAEYAHGDPRKNVSLNQTVYRLRNKLGDSSGQDAKIILYSGKDVKQGYMMASEFGALNIPGGKVIKERTTRRKPRVTPLTATGKEEAEVVSSDQLTDEEVYLLASILSDEETAKKLGISLHDDDKQEVQNIMDKVLPNTDLSDSVKSTLLEKLQEFLRNSEKVFVANINSEDAQYLLTFLARVGSEAKLKEALA